MSKRGLGSYFSAQYEQLDETHLYMLVSTVRHFGIIYSVNDSIVP